MKKRRELELSQADVAELAGVSLNWYQQFESGRGNRPVSVRFIETIGEALRLDPDARLELFRLVTPESQHAEVAAVVLLQLLPGFVKDVIKARSVREALFAAAQVMHSVLCPDIATAMTLREDNGVKGTVLGDASGFSKGLHRVIWERYSNTLIAHVTGADFDQDRSIAGPLNAASWLAVGVRHGEVPRAILSAFWRTPRRFSGVEMEMARGIAAIAEVIAKN